MSLTWAQTKDKALPALVTLLLGWWTYTARQQAQGTDRLREVVVELRALVVETRAEVKATSDAQRERAAVTEARLARLEQVQMQMKGVR